MSATPEKMTLEELQKWHKSMSRLQDIHEYEAAELIPIEQSDQMVDTWNKFIAELTTSAGFSWSNAVPLNGVNFQVNDKYAEICIGNHMSDSINDPQSHDAFDWSGVTTDFGIIKGAADALKSDRLRACLYAVLSAYARSEEKELAEISLKFNKERLTISAGHPGKPPSQGGA